MRSRSCTTWSCGTCTLANPAGAALCSCCGAYRNAVTGGAASAALRAAPTATAAAALPSTPSKRAATSLALTPASKRARTTPGKAKTKAMTSGGRRCSTQKKTSGLVTPVALFDDEEKSDPASSTPLSATKRQLFSRGNAAASSAAGGCCNDAPSQLDCVLDALDAKNAPPLMRGRETEQGIITSFIDGCLAKQQGASLYICGSPGTGKSASIEFLRQQLFAGIDAKHGTGVRVVTINAMTLKDPKNLYVKLLESVTGRRTELSAVDAAEALQDLFLSAGRKQPMTVVVVDEIDGLLSRAQTVLYRLFEWPLKKKSRLVLLGVANAMDLTERFLPRLTARKCSPQVLIFQPYTQDQMYRIVCQRLHIAGRRAKGVAGGAEADKAKEDDNAMPLFDKAAVEMCARKIASMSGDVRKCLAVCRVCLEDVQRERDDAQLEGLLGSVDEEGVAAAVEGSNKENEPPLRVEIRHMAKALRTSLGSACVARIQALPQHMQILLCIAAIALKRNSKDATMERFQATYVKLSKHLSLPRVSSSNFSDVFANLIDAGLVRSVDSGGSKGANKRRLFKVALNVTYDDIEYSLHETPFFARLLEKGHSMHVDGH